MDPISGSVTIVWTPPSVSGTQLPVSQYLIVQNDLVAGTRTQVGAPLASQGNSFTTGAALPPSGRFTFDVQAIDSAGNKGPVSDASNEIDTAAPPAVDPPGAPTGVGATLNP